MSYKEELANAKTVKECQQAYNKECERLFEEYAGKFGRLKALEIMVDINWNYYMLGEQRAVEIAGRRLFVTHLTSNY